MWRKTFALALLFTMLSNMSAEAFLFIGSRQFATARDDGSYFIDIMGPFRGKWNSSRLEDVLVLEAYHRYLGDEVRGLTNHLYSDVLDVLDHARDDSRNQNLGLGGRYDLQLEETSFMGPGKVRGISDNVTDEEGVLYYRVSLDLRNYPSEVREEVLRRMEKSRGTIESVPLLTRGGASLGAGEVFHDVTRDPRTGEILFINHVVYYAVPMSALEERTEQVAQNEGVTGSNPLPQATDLTRFASCSQFESRDKWESYIANLTEVQGIGLTRLDVLKLDDCGVRGVPEPDSSQHEFTLEHPGFGCEGTMCLEPDKLRNELERWRQAVGANTGSTPSNRDSQPHTSITPSEEEAEQKTPDYLTIEEAFRQYPCLLSPEACENALATPPETKSGDEDTFLEQKPYYTHILE